MEWARRPGESDRAYTLFLTYRDQSAPRSIRRVVACSGLMVSTHEASELAKAFDWAIRSRAFDDHLQSIRDEAQAEVARYTSADRAASQERLMAMTSDLVERELGKTLRFANGTEAPILKPEHLLARIPEILKTQRLLAGESTENVKQETDYSDMSLEELLEVERFVSEMKGKRNGA